MFTKTKQIKNLPYYSSDSRYSKSLMYYDALEEKYFIDLPKALEIPTSDIDFLYVVEVKYKNRLDLIASMYYNNSKLWWVIAEANKIADPTNIPVGTSLVIPNTSTIFGGGGVLG
jgi:hypothetical protein